VLTLAPDGRFLPELGPSLGTALFSNRRFYLKPSRDAAVLILRRRTVAAAEGALHEDAVDPAAMLEADRAKRPSMPRFVAIVLAAVVMLIIIAAMVYSNP
jgi:hypothetical protein